MPPTSIPSSKRGWPNIRAITCTSPRPTLVGSTKSSAGLASLPNRQFAADPFAACVSWFLTSNVSSTTITPISAHSAGRLRPIPSSRRSNAYVKLFMGQDTRLLCSIPGVAQTTAAKLLSELAGKEFHSARQLAAYAGLTPSEFRSGTSAYGKTHLCKIGNAFLRKALYLPAAVAKKWCLPLKPWIAILESRKLHHLAIRGAIMRKLLHIAFGVLKHQKPFNPLLVFIPKTL